MSHNPFLMLHRRMTAQAALDRKEGGLSLEEQCSSEEESPRSRSRSSSGDPSSDEEVAMPSRFLAALRNSPLRDVGEDSPEGSDSEEELSGAAASPGRHVPADLRRPRLLQSSMLHGGRDDTKEHDDDDSDADVAGRKSSNRLIAAASERHESRGANSTLGAVNLQLQSALRLGVGGILAGGSDEARFENLGFGALEEEEPSMDGMEQSLRPLGFRRVRINSRPDIIVYTPKTAVSDDNRSVCSSSSDNFYAGFDSMQFSQEEAAGTRTPECIIAGPSGLPAGLTIRCRNENAYEDDNKEFWADRTMTVSPSRAGKPSYLASLKVGHLNKSADNTRGKRKHNEPPGAPKAGVASDSDTSEDEDSSASSREDGGIPRLSGNGIVTIKRPFTKEGFAGIGGGGHATTRDTQSPIRVRSSSSEGPSVASVTDAASGWKRSRQTEDSSEQVKLGKLSLRVSAPALGPSDVVSTAKLARLSLQCRSPHQDRDESAVDHSPSLSHRSCAGSEPLFSSLQIPPSPVEGDATVAESPAVTVAELLGPRATLRFHASAACPQDGGPPE